MMLTPCPLFVEDDRDPLYWHDLLNHFSIETGCMRPAVYLSLSKAGLWLYLKQSDQDWCYQVDFVRGPHAFRAKMAGRRQLIARACGFPKNQTVLDLTAGFGRDGFVLASLGARVHLVESNLVVAALLADGIERFKASEAYRQQAISYCYQSAQCYLEQLAQKPDVIYIDPMFGEAAPKAQVKKELQVIRFLVGQGQDNADLLEPARHSAIDRVVIKRAKQAAYLNQEKPDLQLFAKNCRYDIYFAYGRQKNKAAKM